jgi:hypothetical protein
MKADKDRMAGSYWWTNRSGEVIAFLPERFK